MFRMFRTSRISRISRKNPVLLLLTVILAATSLLTACSSDDPAGPVLNTADVDTYVESLPTWSQFSPPLVNETAMIADPADTTIVEGSQEYDCNVTHYSVTNTPREIVVFSPDADVLWPGSLLQGDKYAGGLGSLGELPIRQRAPLKVFTDLLTEDVTRTVNDPDAASVAVAVGELIQQATDQGHVAGSSIDFDQKTTYSLRQASLDLGISVNYLGNQVESSLSMDRSVEENSMTAYFTQKMFTVSVVQPQTPSDLFSADFTADHLQDQIDLGRIGPDNLPTYISSVVYGRMLMLTMTSNASVEEMSAALQATRDGIGSGSVDGHHLEVLQNSRLRVTTVGGVDEGVEGLITSGQLSDYFAADAPLTAARPLSYTVRNLADSSIASVSETTEYAINECTQVQAEPTGYRYSIKIDKYRVTDYGCDLWPGVEPEVYYTFELHRDGQNVTVMASTSAGQAVESEENVDYYINSPTFYSNLYFNGQGSMTLIGTMWDQDDGNDETMGSWTIAYEHDQPNGQQYYTRSSCGEVRLYVTVNRVGELYD